MTTGSTPTTAGSGPPWRSVALFGATGVAIALGGLVLVQLEALQLSPVATSIWAGVVLVVAWAMSTAGSMAWRGLRQALPVTGAHVVVVAAAVPVWIMAVAAEQMDGAVARSWTAAVIGLMALGYGLASSRRPPPQAIVSALLAAFLVIFGSSALFQRELYPLAPFRMYASVRLDPFEVARHSVIGTTRTGREIPIGQSLGTATLAEMVGDPDDTQVAAALRRVMEVENNTRQVNVVSAKLISQVWRVVPHPGPADVELLSTEVRLFVGD